MESVRTRLRLEFIRTYEQKEILKRQSKLTFNGIHKSYEKWDAYIFKKNELLMYRHFYLGFAILELSKLLLYETYYEKTQPYFGRKNLQLHYMETKSFMLRKILSKT